MSERRLARGTYIGGHEASAVVGAHPFMTEIDVWAKLTGRDKRDISQEPAVRRGRIVEPGLLDEVEAMNGKPLRRDLFVTDDALAFVGGTIDAIDDEGTIYEVTSTTSRGLDSWGADGDPDGASVYKWLQVQWYLGIENDAVKRERGVIVLFVVDTGEIRRYPVERSETTIAELRAKAQEFYRRHVVEKVPPDVDLSTMRPDAQRRAIEWLSVDAKGDAVMTRALAEAALAYQAASDAAKEADAAKSNARVALIAALGQGERSKGEIDGRHVSVSHTKTKGTTSTDWQAVAGDLARKLSLSDVAFGELVQSFTNTSDGFRRLTVRVK